MNRRDLARRTAALVGMAATPGTPPAQWASVAALQAEPGGGASVYNVKAPPFSALGDGASDDLVAINAAIEACAAAGGGTVYFPPGTYVVGVGPTAWIVARSNVTLQGVGAASRIQVKDDAGNYPAVVSPAPHDAFVSGFTMRDLAVDQNAAGNTTSDIQSGMPAAFALFGAYFLTFDDLVFDNVVWTYVGGNCLMCNGDGTGAENLRITACRFAFVRGASATQPDYDNSAIYVVAKNAFVSTNRFTALLGERARGAIEIHAPLAVVTANIVDGFEAGVHVVSETNAADSLDTGSVLVAVNTIRNASLGITVQASTGFPLRNVGVLGNLITIDQIAHDRPYCGGILTAAGTGAEGNYRDITISDNTVRFAYELDAGRIQTTDGQDLAEYLNAGISILCAAGSIVQGFQVVHNQIEAAPFMGILLGAPGGGMLRAGLVKDNVLINPGQNVGATFQGYRAAVFGQAVVFDGVTVEQNHHHDTGRADGTTPYGSDLWSFTDPAAGSERLIVRDNRSRVRVGSLAQPAWGPTVQRDEAQGMLAWPPIPAGATVEVTMAVRGVVVGDAVAANPRDALEAGILKAYERVAAVDTVAIGLANLSAGPITPAAQPWDVAVRTRQG